jgi:alpha-L-rhamnosidase
MRRSWSRRLGEQDRAAGESRRAQHVRSGLYEKCWDAGHRLLADNPAHNAFSQQTNVLGVLFDVIPPSEQQGVLQQVMGIAPGTTSGGILSSSYYFRFYLARALDHPGWRINISPV